MIRDNKKIPQNIYVTKPFLPPRKEFDALLDTIWEEGILTNNGPMVQELEKRLQDYLQVKNLLFTSNGTISIQMAIKALELKGEIITTPFSYIATSNAIVWEGCSPVFADIDPETWNLDPSLIESKITKNTVGILATHVFGNPCDDEKISTIAEKHGLPVIYDAAHAFGVKYQGISVFNMGMISTTSFHATKLFHTGEGGAIVCNNDTLNEKLKLIRSFGHCYDDYYLVGINGKNSELHAAMGLSVLKYIDDIVDKRRELSGLYDTIISWTNISKQKIDPEVEYNYGYYPVLLPNDAVRQELMECMMNKGIYPRRYFYPSLNNLKFLCKNDRCKVSENIASRILCLPLYYDIPTSAIETIARLINTRF